MPDPTPAWRPSLENVATHLLARTLGSNGQIQGTFNEYTKPTGDQVDNAITEACTLLAPRLGEAATADHFRALARSIAALRAALIVERANFPEQTTEAMSPYVTILADYKAALCDWDDSVSGNEAGGPRIGSIRVGTLYPGYATQTF